MAGRGVAHPDEIRAQTFHSFPFVDRLIVVVDVHDLRRVRSKLRLVVHGVRDDDDAVAGLHQPSGRAIEDHITGPALHHIGLEPSTVVDVEHRDLLELPQVGERHQLAIERDRADVVDIGARHRGAVHLRLHHRALHNSAPVTVSSTLSISRVAPTRAGSAMSTTPSRRSTDVSSFASRTSTYSSSTSGSLAMVSVTSAAIAVALRSPL